MLDLFGHPRVLPPSLPRCRVSPSLNYPPPQCIWTPHCPASFPPVSLCLLSFLSCLLFIIYKRISGLCSQFYATLFSKNSVYFQILNFNSFDDFHLDISSPDSFLSSRHTYNSGAENADFSIFLTCLNQH